MSLIQYRPGGGSGVVGTTKAGGGVGPPGPQGPQGVGVVVSAFSAINGGSVVLTTSYSLIHSTTITTTGVGYILGQSTVQIKNDDNIDHWVDFYMVVNGSTSNTTSEDIRKPSGGVSGYANLFLIHRSDSVSAATYNIQVYGKVREALNTAGSLVVDHLDLSGLGNLA